MKKYVELVNELERITASMLDDEKDSEVVEILNRAIIEIATSDFNTDEDYETCPKCKKKEEFGVYTVMNNVDKCLQVPSLLKRLKSNSHPHIHLWLGVPSHSHILFCHHCKTYFVADSDIILTEDEAKECDELHDKYCWA